MYTYVPVSSYTEHVYTCFLRPKEDYGYHGAGVLGNCELPNIDAGSGLGCLRRAASALTQ